jgi:hemolysin activation/secretion protein
MVRTFQTAAALAAMLVCAQAHAQAQAPDAGRLLQERVAPPVVPRPDAAPLVAPPSTAAQVAPGGAAVLVRQVRIEGLTALDPAAIAAQLPFDRANGERLDLAGLRKLAAAVEEAVRSQGLPFARAYLPPQELDGGIARIAVVEGRYGQVTATGDAKDDAQRWLSPLQAGQPILAAPLERSVLLLGELPGVQVSSILKPGAQAGAGDLDVQVGVDRGVHGEIGLDNHGNRYAGRHRVRAALDSASRFTFGDQLSVRASVTDERTWTGSLGYAVPLGTQGLRGQLALSRTDYRLGKEFAALDAHGTADIASATLAYPLLRSRDVNVRVSGALQAKRLHDERDAVGASDRKRSTVIPVSLGADLRGERFVTWGSVALTFGDLDLDAALAAADQLTARSEGRFTRANLELAHLQAVAPAVNLFGRLSAQWASKNLDSSEKMFLGGAYGVRAWPSGEAGGDEGWLAQVEARWRLGSFEPFAFYDAGRVRTNESPWLAGSNHRSIAGRGIGIRWSEGPWTADAAWARRNGAAASQSEPTAGRGRVWASVGWRF